MSKIKIQEASDIGEPVWLHLAPVVEYAIEKGCEFKLGHPLKPFASTKSGDQCVLVGNLTMDDLQSAFEFPDTIQFGKAVPNCFYDKKHHISLCIDKS